MNQEKKRRDDSIPGLGTKLIVGPVNLAVQNIARRDLLTRYSLRRKRLSLLVKPGVRACLKKIVSSEYACIGCLLLLFTISIVVAFLVVFKDVPNIGADCKVAECKDCKKSTPEAGPETPKSKECKGAADSERLKRKIEMLSNKRLKKGFIGVNEFRKNDDKGYDDVLSGRIGIPGVAGIDFGPSFRELNSVDESEPRQPNDVDLSHILDADNMDIQNNEKLRDFYKKLVQTDARIKALKKINQDESYEEDIVQKSPERSRRSLKLYNYPKRYRVLRRPRSLYKQQQKVNQTRVAKKKSVKETRLQRFDNEAEEPTGFIIEKKKLLVQYKPTGKRRLPVKKCQHAPAGTHTHEKEMMHPFYKNTQRLDILLDKFLNKDLPEIISDPFGIDQLFRHEKLNKPCKHPKLHKNVMDIGDEQLLDQIPKPKLKFKKIKDGITMGTSSTLDFFKVIDSEYTTPHERDFYSHELKKIGKQKSKIMTRNPNDFEVMLSVSTILSPQLPKMTKKPSVRWSHGTKLPYLDRVPSFRRLMQLEAGEDEENLGYEDFKEVLTDDMHNHDEVEKSVDRKRRDNDQPEPLKLPKFNYPQSIHNPNWKDAMPLYPDEINSMLANKVLPKPTDELELLLAAQRKGRDLSDKDYVEDYLVNKLNRLVQQAQAYSDYGVLDGKKESRNEKDLPTANSAPNHKVQLSADENFNRAGLLERINRGRVPRFVTSEPYDIKTQGAYDSEITVTLPGPPAQTGIDFNYLKVATLEPEPLTLSEGLGIEMIPTTTAREDFAKNFENINYLKVATLEPEPLTLSEGLGTEMIPTTTAREDFAKNFENINYLKVATLEPEPLTLSEGLRIEMIPTTTAREELANNFENINFLKVATLEPNPRTLSEGLRIELIPTTIEREDHAQNFENIMKIVSKHVKLKPKKVHAGKSKGPQGINSTIVSKRPNVKHTTTSAKFTTMKGEMPVVNTLNELPREKAFFFAITRGRRRLLSSDFKSSSNFRDYKNRRANGRRNTVPSSTDRFVHKLLTNKYLDMVHEKSLSKYIQTVTQKNIKIFSTPGPSAEASRLLSEAQNLSNEESNIPSMDPIDVGKYPMEFHNVDAKLSDTEVTINKSQVRTNTGDNFFGKILVTVKDPEFGVKSFQLMFDVPLVMNFNDETKTLNDNVNYPNGFNKFEVFTDSTVDPQSSDMDAYEDMDSYPDHGFEDYMQNEIIVKRVKRETSVNATWSDSPETREYTKKDSNLAELSSEPGTKVIPAVTFNSTNSSVSTAPAVILTLVHTNKYASSTPTSKIGRHSNSSVPVADNIALSEFFGVVANWFRTLEHGNQDKPTRVSSGSGVTDNLLTINSNITDQSNVTSTDSVYPLYDSDMIENIGHRSRVLLSVEDNVTNVTEENRVVNSTNATTVTAASTATEVSNRTISTTATTDVRSNVTTTKNSPDNKTFHTTKKDNNTKVKAVVKRNADDSNLVFWNDIYDDEYGIQSDKMDNYMKDKLDNGVRDKQSVKEKDFIKRSGRWVQNKLRKFAKNLKINPHSNDVASVHSDDMETKERVPRSTEFNKNHGLVAPPHTYERVDDQVGRKEKDDRDEIEEDYPDVDQKSLFAALTVNMKEVCKKAAQAVRQTRNMKNEPDNLRTKGGARDESKEGSIANALMQQLVRLMTDLVDYQVQQKTCTKLPADLQNFLQWLTYSKEEPEESDKQSQLLLEEPNLEDEELIDDLREGQEDKSEFPDLVGPRTKQATAPTAADDKTRYEDSLHSIQDLLEEYDEMNDDEKSKVLGVRGYLEREMAILKQRLSAYELYKFIEKRDIKRNKRDLYLMKQQTAKHRPRRRLHRFIKNFGKKHTRTTAGYHDEVQVTDIVMNRKTGENKETIHPASDKNVHQKITKRNLQDVYYKAVAAAKKISSAKINHKKDEIGRFESSTAMGHT